MKNKEKMPLIKKVLLVIILILLLIVIFIGFIYPRYIVNLNNSNNQIEINNCLDISFSNGDDLSIKENLESNEVQVVIVNKCEENTDYTISLETLNNSNILGNDIDVFVNDDFMKLEYLPSGIKKIEESLDSYMIVQGSLAGKDSKASYKIKLRVNEKEINDFQFNSKLVVY